MAGYTEHDRARYVPETGKNPGRRDFERDRARVLHSSALRRLAAKTQVVTAGEQDFPRTRLTHSLECAQIGREMGKALGCDPDLVETACLAHDLGHPPFGHNGEAALDEVARSCGGFEGNAQSLRILSRLEAKVDGAGLNLTRAVLDAAIKYPWVRNGEGKKFGVPATKFGVYADDVPVFEWIREDAADRHPRFEAQIMDWADDVAYSVHDLEDTLHAGHVTFAALRDPAERQVVCELTAKRYCDASSVELEEIFADLVAQPYWPDDYDGTLRGLAALKNLTTELIGHFCGSAERATREGGCRDLIVPRIVRLQCALLKGVTAHYVMNRDDHHAAQAMQRELIKELAAMITKEHLEPALLSLFEAADDDAARLRVIIDQIASLTDVSAVTWHRRLSRA